MVSSKYHKAADGLTAAFFAAFAAVMLLLIMLLAPHFGLYATVGAATIFTTLLLLFTASGLCAAHRHTPASRLNPQRLLIMGAFAAFLAYVSCCMTCSLPSDTRILYDSAAALLQHGTLEIPYDFSPYFPNVGFETLSHYFCRYYNNIAMLLILTAIYAVGQPLGFVAGQSDGQIFAVAVTALAAALTVHLLCKSAERIFKSSSAYLQCLLLNICFLSYYYSCANFYTDIWILLPIAAGLHAAVRHAEDGKPHRLIAASLCWAVACQLKITGAIAIIALCICIALKKDMTLKKKAASLLLLLLPFLLLTALFSLWYRNCPIFDFSCEEKLYFPWTTWVLYGSSGVGAYDHSYSQLIYNMPYAERDAYTLQLIRENYAGYSFAEFLQFLKTKFIAVWGDGLFEGGIYAQWSLMSNWTNRFTNPLIMECALASLWADAFTLMLYCCGLAASAVQAKRRDSNWLLFGNVFIFGLMLYLSIFECAPRRAMPAILFFMLDAVYLLRKVTGALIKKLPQK